MGVGACGGDDDEGGGGGGESGGKTLTVYSSLPLQGASRPQTTALVNGIKLALEQAGGKAGEFTVKYQSLDDSTAQAGSWTPEATQANARKVAQDDSAAVYIGEFNSGASAVSIPILNEAGVPQISPANTYVGLTSDEPGSEPGEPEKFYPTGQRTYTRIVPKDTIQAAALATVMKEDGCTNVQLANDKEVYGAGLAKNI
jgi:branched-chain amino acid transport system substrate-binding protein